MNLFIKLLVFSFPFVLVGALYWPVFEEKSSPATAVIEEDPLLKPSPIIENYKPDITSLKKPKASALSPESLEQKPRSNIYRWVDENGRVNFSDR
ncbi:MAG: DUF4124 domain-containing protein, partial [Anaerolineaceae bacterium]|nr:DUF4124 domain-containing protein [Anaerolineaceae bacterium]